MTAPLWTWLDGQLRRDGHANLMAHGLHYGTGVFEGIRAYPTARGPAVFRLRDHLLRMEAGANALGLPLPDLETLANAVQKTLDANGQTSAYIRPLAWYDAGGLTLDVDSLIARCAIATLPWRSHLGAEAVGEGVALAVSPWRRTPASSLPPLKLTGGYTNSILAKKAVVARGFDEALFVDADGHVCEATGENVFIVQGGQVVAVSHPDALDGITRRTVIALSGAVCRPVTLRELLDADEVFLTGTSAEVAPVTRLDSGRTLAVGPITRALQGAYQDLVHGRDRGHEHWLSWAA